MKRTLASDAPAKGKGAGGLRRVLHAGILNQGNPTTSPAKTEPQGPFRQAERVYDPQRSPAERC